MFPFLLYINIGAKEQKASIHSEVSGTVAYFWGDGSIKAEDVQGAGTHTLFIKIIIKSGPDGVCDGAFSGCTCLEEIYISDTIKSISGKSFSSNPNLIIIEVNSSNRYIWSDSKALYDKNKTRLIRVAQGIKEYQIIQTVESIDDHCFMGNIMDEVVITKNVVSIGGDAFQSNKIKEVKFEEGSKYKLIKSGTFWYQSAKIVHIPPSVCEIQNSAFVSGQCTKIIFDDIKNSNLTKLGTYSLAGNLMDIFNLPSKIESLPDNCLSDMRNLEEINIPTKCSSISLTAFAGCPKLIRITIDSGNSYFKYNSDGVLLDTLETIIYMLKEDCVAINISSSIQSIASSVLQARNISTLFVSKDNEKYGSFENVLYNKDFSELIAIPGAVKKAKIHGDTVLIKSKAAQGTSIEEFDCKDSKKLKTIESFAFSESNIKSFYFPLSVQTLSNSIFLYCHSIKNVTFSPEITLLKTLDYNIFRGTSLVNIWLCDSIKVLSRNAFCDSQDLKNVYLSSNSNLNTIEKECFLRCKKLSNWTFWHKVITAGSSAFEGCTNLDFDFSYNQLETIGNSAFLLCQSLTTVYLKRCLTLIETAAFSKCFNLVSLIFDDEMNIDSFGSSCFSYCSNLMGVEIPSSITTLDYSIFYKCSNLTTVDIADGNSIFSKKDNIIYKENVLIFCPSGLKEAQIAEGITSILGNAFYSCEKLKKVIFPNFCEISIIKSNTFGECIELESIKIPQSVVTLESNSFYRCSKLQTVEFMKGSKLNNIGESTFSDCIELKNVTFDKESFLTSISPNAFKGCKNLVGFTFPNSLQSIGANCFAGTGIDKIEFGIESDVNPTENSFDYMSELEIIVFSGKMNKIISGLFKGCNKLKTIIFPEQAPIKEIPINCFKNAIGLEKIQFSYATTILGEGAFEGLEKLKDVSGIEGIEIIGKRTFKNTGLNNIFLETIKCFDESSFESCSKLKKVIIRKNTTLTSRKISYLIIPKRCFYKCTQLNEFTFDCISEYKESSFEETAFSELLLPKNAKILNFRSFAKCQNLEKIQLEGNQVQIKNEAFYENFKLKQIKFCGSKAETSDKALSGSETSGLQVISILVSIHYQSNTFCGLLVSKRIGDECNILQSVQGYQHYALNRSVLMTAASISLEDTECSTAIF